jgi:flagellar protein FliJ
MIDHKWIQSAWERRISVQRAEKSPLTADYRAMNGQFRFRLERVRALRERHEDAAKEALAGAMVQHRRCADAVAQAAEKVEQARAAQLEASATAMSATDLIARQAYLERTEKVHQAGRRELHRHELEVGRKRDALTEAARDRQALERLKEHRRRDHERETARLEGLALDEIAINGFRRNAA